MRRKHFTIFILGLAIAGILIYPILGCSKHEDRRTDAFFFTKDHNTDGIEKPGPQINFHLPFTKRYCVQCHLSSGFADPQQSGWDEPVLNIEAQAMPNAKRLVLPVDQLCMKCHGYDTSKKIFGGELWIHAPLAQGACIFCHNPHKSENPYLLRSQSSSLCADRCHLEGYIMKVKVHQGSRECIECHNPHIGINALMLKKDYKEVWLKPRRTWINSERDDRQ